MKSTITAVLIGMSLSGIAMAECQPNLSADETINCINYEGATYSKHSYVDEDIKDTYNSSNKQEKSETASLVVKD